MTIGKNHRKMTCIAVVTHDLVQMSYFPASFTNELQEMHCRYMQGIVSERVQERLERASDCVEIEIH
jgi:hypothetical protein